MFRPTLVTPERLAAYQKIVATAPKKTLPAVTAPVSPEDRIKAYHHYAMIYLMRRDLERNGDL